MENAANDNIVLIGMPGAGKSTLGIVLAKIMNYNRIDADLVIQNQCDRTLQKIIDGLGPEGFIQVENQILKRLEGGALRHRHGRLGGVLRRSHAASRAESDERVVYLKISYEELVRRLSDLQERGVVLKGGIGMSSRELFDERKPLYEQYADVTVDVDDLSITAAARKVADAIEKSRLFQVVSARIGRSARWSAPFAEFALDEARAFGTTTRRAISATIA